MFKRNGPGNCCCETCRRLIPCCCGALDIGWYARGEDDDGIIDDPEAVEIEFAEIQWNNCGTVEAYELETLGPKTRFRISPGSQLTPGGATMPDTACLFCTPAAPSPWLLQACFDIRYYENPLDPSIPLVFSHDPLIPGEVWCNGHGGGNLHGGTPSSISQRLEIASFDAPSGWVFTPDGSGRGVFEYGPAPGDRVLLPRLCIRYRIQPTDLIFCNGTEPDAISVPDYRVLGHDECFYLPDDCELTTASTTEYTDPFDLITCDPAEEAAAILTEVGADRCPCVKVENNCPTCECGGTDPETGQVNDEPCGCVSLAAPSPDPHPLGTKHHLLWDRQQIQQKAALDPYNLEFDFYLAAPIGALPFGFPGNTLLRTHHHPTTHSFDGARLVIEIEQTSARVRVFDATGILLTNTVSMPPISCGWNTVLFTLDPMAETSSFTFNGVNNSTAFTPARPFPDPLPGTVYFHGDEVQLIISLP